jgi:predicted RNase H-like nuclease (RuvC/YqgF family)
MTKAPTKRNFQLTYNKLLTSEVQVKDLLEENATLKRQLDTTQAAHGKSLAEANRLREQMTIAAGKNLTAREAIEGLKEMLYSAKLAIANMSGQLLRVDKADAERSEVVMLPPDAKQEFLRCDGEAIPIKHPSGPVAELKTNLHRAATYAYDVNSIDQTLRHQHDSGSLETRTMREWTNNRSPLKHWLHK